VGLDSPGHLDRGGAAGYLLKDTPREGLIAAIEDAAAAKSPVDPGVAHKLFAHVAGATAPDASWIAEALSERELDVLRLLARGMTNAGIAERLYLSEGTVRNYVSAILSKLNVADRTQAALLALRHGLGAGDV
jgi:NarL family two-component system response regulator LiaR